jgi:hypothetical protein
MESAQFETTSKGQWNYIPLAPMLYGSEKMSFGHTCREIKLKVYK